MATDYRLDGPAGAPVLVLSAPLGTTSAVWEPQMAAFTAHFRVLRYEHRGHGGSPAPSGPYAIEDLGADLVALLDHLDLDRVSVCGSSLGGMVGMWVAAVFPDRVDRLVLACTAPRLEPAEAWSSRAAEVRRAGTQAQLEGHLSRWFTPGFTSARPDVVRHVAEMLDATDPEGYAGCCEAIGAMDQRNAMGSIKAPTLVLAGAEDPVVPPPLAVDVQSSVAGSSLVVLAGAAHLANVERPMRFTDAAVDHLLGSAYERGQAVRRAVLGDDHVDRAASRSTSFTAAFQDLIARYAWGDIWTRPGLDRATRSAVTLTALVAQGRFDELPMHVMGALRNGMSREEIEEVLLQVAVYCGVPAANTAFAVAQRTLDETDDG